jgi:uncharacterized protein RhaS with RHS repeats
MMGLGCTTTARGTTIRSLQRFVAEDPIGFAGGGVNFYTYADGDPVSLVDPLGLKVIYPPGIVPPNQAVQDILDRIDQLNGDSDVIVISGTRTPGLNDTVGGVPDSGS